MRGLLKSAAFLILSAVAAFARLTTASKDRLQEVMIWTLQAHVDRWIAAVIQPR